MKCGDFIMGVDDSEFKPLPDCPSDCYDFERHVMGCPHGPEEDYDDDPYPDRIWPECEMN